jgi:hypothetical protein
MGSRNRFLVRALVLCTMMALAAKGTAAPAALEPFFGDYQGEAVSKNAGEVRKRDLRVKIAATGKGFTVNWISVTGRPDGTLKRKEYSIDFLPTKRKNIFRSGERKDMFGNAVPLDPMEGDPYVWARVHEDTLTVFALHILEDGGYELQTYVRERIPEGLSLKYSRIRDGKILGTVTGTLLEVR